MPFFENIRKQSGTPTKRQAPSSPEKKGTPQKWDYKVGTKDDTFTARLHAWMIEYNAVVT